MCAQPFIPDDEPSPTTTTLPLFYYITRSALQGEYGPDNHNKDDSDLVRLRRNAPDDMLLKLVGIVLAE